MAQTSLELSIILILADLSSGSLKAQLYLSIRDLSKLSLLAIFTSFRAKFVNPLEPHLVYNVLTVLYELGMDPELC